MHDGLLQDVNGMALQLGAVLPHVRELPAAAARLEGILALAERAGREARQALQGMRREAPAVDVAAAVQHEAQRVCAPTTIVLTVRVAGQARPVGSHVCEAVVAIVHEALTNVLKHAAARRVRVAVACTDRRLRLSVRDDGRGLTMPTHEDGAGGHFGMTGMRERASAIGATLAVTSAAGRGTAVRLDVPFARGRAALSRRGG
jgi:signal transduction histidine kinase